MDNFPSKLAGWWIVMLLVLMLAAPAWAQPSGAPAPLPATQAEVNAGAKKDKYVSPATLAGASIVTTPISWEGEWNAGTDYALGDGVDYQGSSYVARGNPTTGDVPGVDVDWQLVNTSPDKHRAYAVQWFTMAVVLLVFFLLRSSNLWQLLRPAGRQ
jgi:cytochrome oxidase assembly protein ShyY1